MDLRKFVFGFLSVAVWSCASDASQLDPALDAALNSITAGGFTESVRTLSSDEFEGRLPSTLGEELTINYLRQRFVDMGVQPGNGESFFQEVPLVEITSRPDAHLVITGRGPGMRLEYGVNSIVVTRRVVERVELSESEMVFVGYGIVAPEYGWNDYQGLDVRGKTVVMLVNDPGFATQDSSLFNGNSMTYYGRWTYKYEEASRQGAEAALVIHQTEPAGYGWNVVSTGWSGPQFGLVAADSNMSRVAVEGWISEGAARGIFALSHVDFDSVTAQAARPGFRAVPLIMRASTTLNNTIKQSVSNNVLGLLRGSERPDEIVVYMAHWDHLGNDESIEGDGIYNGAADNATGMAAILEIAGAFVSLPQPPKRSILFLAVTAEEQGLLGSAYYGENPVYPKSNTVAAINIDGVNLYGEMNDITIVGMGNSELDDYVTEAAAAQGRVVRPDPEPEKGYFYRSDHFSFAKQGIPALYTDNGIDHVEHGVEWTLERMAEYRAERYHQPTDEFDPNWDVAGALQDIRLLFRVGYRLSNESTFPNWNEGTEFRVLRDAMMED